VPLSCLLVDDSEEFLRSATRLLSLQGINIVGQASSGVHALRLANELRPDVALVDVELGEEDGIELAGRMLASGLSTHVVLISIRDREDLTELMEGSGAAGFLRKDALGAHAIESLITNRRAGNAGPEPRFSR
jgi:two-component system, NarL family, nitrate/nitrite response regulator NarL